MTIREIKAKLSTLNRQLEQAWEANDSQAMKNLDAEIWDCENMLGEIPTLEPNECFGMAYDLDDAEMQDDEVFGKII